MTMVTLNLNWSQKYIRSVIKSDAKGYYAWLPAIFIYKDLNFGFFDKIEKEKYQDKFLLYDYRTMANGKVIDKYFCGTALAQLPFFIGAHIISKITGQDMDGYSSPYAVSVTLAALFYLLVSLIFLRKILLLYNVRDGVIAMILPAIVFGTNIFYYTTSEPGMSHIYSLAFFTIFIWSGKKYFGHPDFLHLITMMITLGIITLIRPVNIILIAAIPFLASSGEALWNGFRYLYARPYRIPVCLLIFLVFVSPQIIIYKISTGLFFVYSYGGETFNLLHPHIADFLFSYKKGLFLYSPLILLFLLAGGYFFWKKNRYSFYTFFGFLLITVLILSSWWNWWYGGSFSSRVFMEFLPFVAIAGGTALEYMLPSVKKIYTYFIVILVIICQIQIFQYRYYYIHWSEMTKEKYWDVFLRVDKLIKK